MTARVTRTRRKRRRQDTGTHCLSATCQVRVRFQEVDSLRVVWHGHYLTYVEEGRNAFGRDFDFGYRDILEAGYIAPLVHIELDYLRPAKFDQLLDVTTRMHMVPGARIIFTYDITGNDTGELLASCRTDQVFTDVDGNLVLTRPRFHEEFLERWADSVEPVTGHA